MENTGRISTSLLPAARRVLFDKAVGAAIEEELYISSEVDRAHLVMLAECRIVDREKAARLLRAIERLRDARFAPLGNRQPLRGLYLLYEDYLIETEGPEVGGILQTGRSRNDLNATIHKLKLRRPLIRLLREGLRLQAVLIRRARRYRGVVMPAYTHGQAAMPSSYGHYLAAIAKAVGRDLDGVQLAGEGINQSPLGAGAVGGTTLPIDTVRTARLLGFSEPVENSIDAVASRDLMLRLLSAAAILGVTLSRVAADLLQWATSEFDFLELPDEIVGSSSAMPQKRNPFLLEHVQGRTTSTLGAFVSAMTAIHSTPFTNSIAVGTEAVRHVWQALEDISDALLLIRLVIARAQPRRDSMLHRADAGMTTATALANRIVSETECDFRTSHRIVGEMILHFIRNGIPYQEDKISGYLQSRGLAVSVAGLDPVSITESSEWGGGPGANSIEHSLHSSRIKWADQVRWCRQLVLGWQKAKSEIEEAVSNIGCHQIDLTLSPAPYPGQKLHHS